LRRGVSAVDPDDTLLFLTLPYFSPDVSRVWQVARPKCNKKPKRIRMPVPKVCCKRVGS
jgi:hypothetical protein